MRQCRWLKRLRYNALAGYSDRQMKLREIEVYKILQQLLTTNAAALIDKQAVRYYCTLAAAQTKMALKCSRGCFTYRDIFIIFPWLVYWISFDCQEFVSHWELDIFLCHFSTTSQC